MTVVRHNMGAQEDLVALFNKKFSLEPVVEAPQGPKDETRIVYISQHYNHSAHTARLAQDQQQQQPVQRPASEPSQLEHSAAQAVLRNHGVDPAGLSDAQLQLFKAAEGSQRRRLIELWRICPQTNSAANPIPTWSNTTMEQEEILAKTRCEQKLRGEQLQKQQDVVMSLDGTPVTPIQAYDGRWVHLHPTHYMEPYMASGYEEMARREYEESARRAYQEAMRRPKDVYQHFGTAVGGPTYKPATDPVYQTTDHGLDWATQQKQAMENQYGVFSQIRSDDMEML
jgi:hypothetical protein